MQKVKGFEYLLKHSTVFSSCSFKVEMCWTFSWPAVMRQQLQTLYAFDDLERAKEVG